MRAVALIFACALAACALPHIPHVPRQPTYEFEAAYAPAIATPSGIKADLAAYAENICGPGGYEVLEQLFVGEVGPNYVRIRFGCS
jgi:hypothetical protein